MRRKLYGKMQLFAAASLIMAAYGASAAEPAATPAATSPDVAAPAPASANNAPKIWPVEVFAQLPFMERPVLSPNGEKIAVRMAMDGKQNLAIIQLGGGPDRIRLLPVGESDLNWWRWVNDDWLIVGLGMEEFVQGDPFYITRTLSLSADGKKSNVLAKRVAAQNGDDVIWVAQDGTPRILLAYQTSIFIDDVGFWPRVDEVDVTTGRLRSKILPREHVMSWYADATGVVRMGMGYNDSNRTATLLYRPNEAVSFRAVSRANRRKNESLVVPQIFLADPGKALAVDDQDGFDALYDFDLTTLELGKKIFGVPGFDIDGVVPDASGMALSGVRYTGDREQTNWIDPELAKIQADLDKAVGDRRAIISSMNRDHSRLMVHVGGSSRPGSYYFFDVASGTMNLLASVNETMKGASLAPVRTIRYKARDGLEIAAVLTLPVGKAAKDLPLILMPHGGPFARDSEEWDWWTQFLANRGYAVLQPNYRGSSGYGTAFAEKGEGQWGLSMQDDLNDAVDWAVKEGIADPKRVCIAGASYGGYAAMRAAQRDGGKFRCAISYAGVSDLGAMMRYDGRFLNHGTRGDWMKEQAPDFRSVSPISHAAEFSTPILLMHGKMDRRVQVGQSREMAEKLKAAGKNYIYVEQPLGDHFFTRQADRLDFLTRMEAFLREHNPA